VLGAESQRLRPGVLPVNSTHVFPESTEFFSCLDVNNMNGNPWGCHVVATLGFAVTARILISL
jgi:hypothetical protein